MTVQSKSRPPGITTRRCRRPAAADQWAAQDDRV